MAGKEHCREIQGSGTYSESGENREQGYAVNQGEKREQGHTVNQGKQGTRTYSESGKAGSRDIQ